MRRFFFLVLLAAACGGSSSSPSDASPGSSVPPGAPGATPTPPGQTPSGPATAGAIDPTCGQSGFLGIPSTTLEQIVTTSAGALVATSNGLFAADAAGAVKQLSTGTSGFLLPTPSGGFYEVEGSEYTTAVNVVRLGADMKSDPSFVFDDTSWPAYTFDAAVGADGTLYAAGSVSLNTDEEHVVVRHFLANGKADGAFAVADDQTPKGRGARGIALAKDGGILVNADDGFTPGILRFTSSGVLDASFGKGGDLVVDALGPRYTRAVLVDGEGRILVLGMTNDDVQIARLLANGTFDASFGDSGIATVTIPTKSKSDSSLFVDVEARAMFVDAQGRILVSADEEATPEGKTDPSFGVIHLVRLDASGKLDATFGTAGVATIDFGGGAIVSKNLGGYTFAPLGDGRLLLGGEKILPSGGGGSAIQSAVACVKM